MLLLVRFRSATLFSLPLSLIFALFNFRLTRICKITLTSYRRAHFARCFRLHLYSISLLYVFPSSSLLLFFFLVTDHTHTRQLAVIVCTCMQCVYLD